MRLVAAVLLLAGSPLLAGGFAIQEQGAVGQGRSFAGAAAQWDDAQSQWANPALLTQAAGGSLAGSVNTLFIRSAQADRGTTISNILGTRPVGGGDGGNPFAPVVPVPSGAAALRVGPDTVIGVSLNSPFGLIVNYDAGWFGRYDSLRSKLNTYNLALSVAHRFGALSVGAGIDPQYINAELTSALPNSLGAADGAQRLKGDDWSVGWHAGATLDLGELRLAAAWRSGIRHRLKGQLAISGLSGPLAAGNRVVEAEAPIGLPATGSLAARWQVTPALALLTNLTWTQWSRFDAIRVVTAGGTTVQEQDYRDTISLAFGGDWRVDERWTLRAGVQRDETPTRDGLRTTRVPDGDRTWLSAGATVEPAPGWRLSASYSHIFVSTEAIDRSEPFFAGTPLATTVAVRSSNSGGVDILGLSAAYAW
ncbi:OmpP1/FadL family transporter [Sandaracinobacteroides saxicola]|uniref:TonB-dependent receptor n=1 Tax=Sandaracinobacteroides saxicola TaxID=2759707 RepID=A0A7G5IJY9_9SPHN|nr:outer membrane protein transport protein [Sandaracinobacteroides saxicola]QMW23681.1 TonB-dependent receptor [Sandaracinobacteroides saxicola]